MSGQSPPPIGGNALAAEQARLARFFQTINKHRKALDLAIEEDFGGELDPGEWRSAFESVEPHDANRTMVVTGDHSAVLNAYVEILKASAGARLIGLLPYRRPHAEQVFNAVVGDGGLTEKQAALLSELYVLEGRLEHASPDVDAEEVRDAVVRLRKALPELVRVPTHGLPVAVSSSEARTMPRQSFVDVQATAACRRVEPARTVVGRPGQRGFRRWSRSPA